jgi:hypothetical protein
MTGGRRLDQHGAGRIARCAGITTTISPRTTPTKANAQLTGAADTSELADI